MAEFAIREIQRGVEFNDGHTDEKSLGKLLLDRPDEYTSSLIYLWGQNTKAFPLTTLTEGQIGGVKEIKSVMYEYPVAGRARHADEVASYDDTSNPTPGLAGSEFVVNFRTSLFIEQYGLLAPDGTQYRIMARGQKNSDNSYAYILAPKNPTITCALSNLTSGKFWMMTAPTIPEAYSRGNRDNKRGIGKMFNQISFQRYGMEIGGNIAHKVVTVQFPTEGGGTTNLWVNEQMRQFEHNILRLSEAQHWISTFNRQPDGRIVMKDRDNGEEIPQAAGVMEMVKETNYITYGATLPISMINRALELGEESYTDTGTSETVMYAGRGYTEDFNRGIINDAKSNGYSEAVGDKMINGTYGALSYGNTFTQYRNIHGDTITIKPLEMLDRGLLAEHDKNNGNLHPISRRPMSAHTAIYLDQSIYGGERNVSMAMQKGGGDVYGVVKGLSDIPDSWKSMNNGKLISNEVDASSYHRKLSKAPAILSSVRCVMMQSVV